MDFLNLAGKLTETEVINNEDLFIFFFLCVWC